jgi:hypothetical protein
MNRYTAYLFGMLFVPLALSKASAQKTPGTPADPPAPSLARLDVKETLLGRIPAGAVAGSIVVSPDYTRLAYVIDTGNGQRVIVDGQPQPIFTYVFPRTLRFSPDSKRFAYTVGLNTAKYPPSAVVLDGEQGPVFEKIRPSEDGTNTFFSPDSKRAAYVGEKAGMTTVVVEGLPGKAHAGLAGSAGVIWSRDSKRWGIMVRDTRAGKEYVVVDDVPGRRHDGLVVPVSTNLAASIVVEYTAERGIVFSADSRRVAYGAYEGKHALLIVDGAEVARQESKRVKRKDAKGNEIELSEGGISEISFSPAGDRLAYSVSQGLEKQWFVVDGKKEKEHLAIPFGRFSSDGKHFAYFGITGPKAVLVRDGAQDKTFDAPPEDVGYLVEALAFSPDGNRLAAAVHRNGKAVVIGDVAESSAYDAAIRPLFSPDGQRLCFIGIKKDNGYVVLDNVEGKPFEDYVPPGPFFRSDSRHICYCAKFGGEWRVAVDGLTTRETYGGFVTPAKFVGDQVRVVGIRGNDLLRIDIQPGYGATVAKSPTTPATPPTPSTPSTSSSPTTPKDGWVRLFMTNDDASQWEGLFKHWGYKDGTLVGSNLKDGLAFRTFLCSKKRYKDFELKFEVQLKGGATANSGVNFRSEIIDRSKFNMSGPQADIGGPYWGALSSEFIPGKTSTAVKTAPAPVLAKLKQDDFNEYYIKCVGKHVTIKLNGETTVDEVVPWVPDEGLIGWQIHINKTQVTFRNIELRDLSAGPSTPSTPTTPSTPQAGGWIVLFNGKDLTGWKANNAAQGKVKWDVRSGVLTGQGGGTWGYLYTERGDFGGNFHLRAEARIDAKGNSGLYLFVPGTAEFERSVPGGIEAQIGLTHAVKTGGFFIGTNAAGPGNTGKIHHAAGEWFTLEVIAQGGRVISKVNGVQTGDLPFDPARMKPGHLGIQVHPGGAAIEFRLIEIRPLGGAALTPKTPMPPRKIMK